jgi:hypothetical protein
MLIKIFREELRLGDIYGHKSKIIFVYFLTKGCLRGQACQPEGQLMTGSSVEPTRMT